MNKFVLNTIEKAKNVINKKLNIKWNQMIV